MAILSPKLRSKPGKNATSPDLSTRLGYVSLPFHTNRMRARTAFIGGKARTFLSRIPKYALTPARRPGGRMSSTHDLPLAKPFCLNRVHPSDEAASDSFNGLGVTVAATTMNGAITRVISWLETAESTKLVAFTNVHMLTEAYWNPEFLRILRKMDMNCPDGMPLVWLGKSFGHSLNRVAGPDFMPALCLATADLGYRHFFYGGKPGIAERVIANLKAASPNIQIAGSYTPPFRDLGMEESEGDIQLINESNADIVWVCLGCPKQEMWMVEHCDRLNARVVLSVGMAFDIVAGSKSRAPLFLRKLGLEWLYRMIAEPRRLAGRYIWSNLTFLYLMLRTGWKL